MFSDPVVGENFFGRQEILDLIIKRANGLKAGCRQNVAIIGHQQLGKTSVLRQFLHLYRDPAVICIYVEIKVQALDYFIEQFVRALLFQWLIKRNEELSPTETLSELVSRASSTIPRTVGRVQEIALLLKQRHAEEAYAKLFELTSILKEETGLQAIVILDEFHRLGEFGVKNAFTDFGRRIMVQKNTMYLLSSSSFSKSRRILAEKLSLLFGHFERVYLKPFDFDAAFSFLEKRFLPVTADQTLKDYLIAFTDGHPFFLGTLTGTARELALSKSETVLTRLTIAETLLKTLFESQGVFYQYFQKLISPYTHAHSRGRHLLLLVELAKGKNKLKDLSRGVNQNQKDTSRELKELMEHELIVKTGVFYRFHNRIFKFWLKEVYEKKELSLLETAGKAEDFLRTVEQTIDEYEELSRMNLSDRLTRLLESFQNDIVEFGEKKRQLPHFTEILRPHETASDRDAKKIIAKGNGRCWICRIVEEHATEKDVLDLVSGQATRRSTETRVMLALGGLDHNARLLAKEKKIFALGLYRINMLLDVYGQLPIIRRSALQAAPAA